MPEGDLTVDQEAASGAVGLARRSGQLAWGARAVRERVRDGTARLVVLSCDASPRVRQRLREMARRNGVRVVSGPPGADLGRWCGLATLAAVAILDEGLARSLTGRPEDR